MRIQPLFPIAACLALAACASTSATHAPSAGAQSTVEGQVVSVDTAPWAYDGSAVVTVDTDTRGAVRVQLPARWNLCKAPAPQDIDRLQPGQRVRATGTVSEDGALVVCERAEHALVRIP